MASRKRRYRKEGAGPQAGDGDVTIQVTAPPPPEGSVRWGGWPSVARRGQHGGLWWFDAGESGLWAVVQAMTPYAVGVPPVLRALAGVNIETLNLVWAALHASRWTAEQVEEEKARWQTMTHEEGVEYLCARMKAGWPGPFLYRSITLLPAGQEGRYGLAGTAHVLTPQVDEPIRLTRSMNEDGTASGVLLAELVYEQPEPESN